MVRYSLTKAEHRSLQNLNLEIYNSFVTYGKAGLGHGVIRNKKLLAKDNAHAPIIFGPVYYTKQIYDNFKKDKSRILTLGIKLSQSENEQLMQLREYRENLLSEDQLGGQTAGKRKSLNNGIFKADDIY